MKSITFVYLLGAVLTAYSPLAYSNKDLAEQATIIVTANNYQQSINDVIATHSIITSEEIERLQVIDVIDLLALQTGIDVARTGPTGSASSIFIRGTNSDHVLVLVDGVNVSSTITGSFAWENLPTSQIERIEIIRGPRASIYGSDAIGGVIQIFTKKQDRLSLKYTVGSYDTQNFDFGWGGQSDQAHFSMNFSSQKTDGFSATNQNNFFFNADEDGFEGLSLNLQSSFNLEQGDLDFKYLQTRGDIDFDNGNTDTKNENFSSTYSTQFADWNHGLSLSYNKARLFTAAFDSLFESKRTDLNWLANRQYQRFDLSFGLQWNQEKGLIPLPPDNPWGGSFLNDDRSNKSVFAHLYKRHEKNRFSLSTRYDDNSAYGDHVTGDVAWKHSFNDSKHFKMQYGTAFKAPNLGELFTQSSNFPFGFFGNPELNPEKSKSFELAFLSEYDQHQFSATAFQNRIEDLIQFQFLGDFSTYENVDDAQISGLELEHSYNRQSWQISSNITIQNPQQRTIVEGLETQTQLLRRPKRKLNINVWKSFGQFDLGAQLKYASNRIDFGGIVLDDYMLLDLNASWKINQHWKTSLKLINISDQDYELVRGYNTAGPSAFLSILWQQ